MNLRQLEYFKQIAESRSMTRAAHLLRVTQPSLTRQMQQLEKDLGVLLFYRSDKGVTLTPAGQELLERANSVLAEVRRISDDVGKYATEPKGEFSFGVPPSLYELITGRVLSEYIALYPEVRLRITEGLSGALHEQVLTGKLDAALVSDVEPLDLLHSRPLLREQLFLVGSVSSNLDIARTVTVESLLSRPMLLTSRPNAMRTIVDRHLSALGKALEPRLETNSARLLCDMVMREQGFTVLPYSAIFNLHRSGQLSAAPIESLQLCWTLVHVRERGFSLAAHRLHERLIDSLTRIVRQGTWLGAQYLG
jgi:LysR family nitrogen assimilation transcriptional regulator